MNEPVNKVLIYMYKIKCVFVSVCKCMYLFYSANFIFITIKNILCRFLEQVLGNFLVKAKLLYLYSFIAKVLHNIHIIMIQSCYRPSYFDRFFIFKI